MATSRFNPQPGRSHGKEWSYIVTYYCIIYYYFIRPPSVQLMETGTLYLFYFLADIKYFLRDSNTTRFHSVWLFERGSNFSRLETPFHACL